MGPSHGGGVQGPELGSVGLVFRAAKGGAWGRVFGGLEQRKPEEHIFLGACGGVGATCFLLTYPSVLWVLEPPEGMYGGWSRASSGQPVPDGNTLGAICGMFGL